MGTAQKCTNLAQGNFWPWACLVSNFGHYLATLVYSCALPWPLWFTLVHCLGHSGLLLCTALATLVHCLCHSRLLLCTALATLVYSCALPWPLWFTLVHCLGHFCALPWPLWFTLVHCLGHYLATLVHSTIIILTL